MTRRQLARRIAFWRGFVFALIAFTGFIAALGLVDRITG